MPPEFRIWMFFALLSGMIAAWLLPFILLALYLL